MTRLTFTLAILSSATLLFLVQPLVGRFLLPVLGGSAGVWTTCMVFFQATLLLSYLYADLLTRRCSLAVQLAIHAGVRAAVGAADDIAALRSAKPAWRPIAIPAGAKPWTDDHANLLGAFDGW